jgi:hypothetical protein
MEKLSIFTTDFTLPTDAQALAIGLVMSLIVLTAALVITEMRKR